MIQTILYFFKRKNIFLISVFRRRTDLIRWNMFVTESWWDHKPSNSTHLCRFPVPQQAISGNNALQQNPGYE
jgi:hypothetical protein